MKTIFKNYFKLSTMKEEQLDNIFRQELGQHDSGTPEHLWAGIEARRKKPNRRPAWLLPATGLAVIFALGISAWLFYPDAISPDLVDLKKEKLAVEKPTPIADAILPSEASQINQTAVAETIIDEVTIEATAKSTTVSAASAEKSETTSILKSSGAISKPTVVSNTFLVEKPNGTITVSEKTTQFSNESSSEFSANVSRNNREAVENNQKSAKTETAQITRLLSLKSDLLAINLGELKGPEGCYNFDGRTGGPTMDALSFDLLGGPGFAPRTLKNTGDSENDLYRDAREASEDSWYSFSGLLRANMRYSGGLTFRGGIGYSQINEIFEFRNGSATQTVTTEITNTDGSVTTITTVEEGELYKLTHNRLRFVDIPLTLGYEKQMGKVTFGVNAGASLNIQFTQKGDFLSESGDPVNFTTSNPNKYDYFKTKAGASFIASAGVSYQLPNRFDLHIEPHFRYFSKSLSEGSLEQRYTNFGVRAGVRYNIFDKQRN